MDRNRATTMANLSQELIVEILTYLPVKSLLRCKCVSKSWYSLITSSKFAKWHLGRAKEEKNINRNSRILLPSLPTACSIDFEAARDANEFQAVTVLDYPDGIVVRSDEDDYDDSYVEVLGSCNGLVCLCNEEKNIVVWNPSTRVSKMLPKHSISRLDDEMPKHHIPRDRLDVTFSGLGYDESIDDYKLIVGISQTAVGSWEITRSAEILTLKSNTWRKIEALENVTLMNPGIYLNQHIHWIGRREDDIKRKFEIISFDIKEERFKNVLSFPEVDSKNTMIVSLGLSRDRLCVFYENEENYFQVFVHEGLGDDATWTKAFDVIDSAFGTLKWLPVCLTDKGKLVYDVDKQIALFDPMSSTSCYFHGTAMFGDSNVYLESLVSPYN